MDYSTPNLSQLYFAHKKRYRCNTPKASVHLQCLQLQYFASVIEMKFLWSHFYFIFLFRSTRLNITISKITYCPHVQFRNKIYSHEPISNGRIHLHEIQWLERSWILGPICISSSVKPWDTSSIRCSTTSFCSCYGARGCRANWKDGINKSVFKLRRLHS